MEKKSGLPLLFSILLLSVVASCSDVTGLLPQFTGEEKPEVRVFEAGRMIQGFPVFTPTLQLTGESFVNPPDQMDISVLNRDKSFFDDVLSFQGDLTDPSKIPNVELPLITEPGLYYLRVKLFQSGVVVSTTDTPFFWIRNVIDGVNLVSYPHHALVVGGFGLIRAELQTSFNPLVEDQTFNPYFRWSLDGKVIYEGSLADGLDVIPVKALDKPGFFVVQVEVFPFPPENNQEFSFSSSIRSEIDILSRLIPEQSPSDFTPEENFYTLLHFNGNLDSVGSRADFEYRETSPVPSGLRSSNLNRIIFGLEFSPLEYITLDDFILPMGNNGSLQNHTIMVSGILDSLSSGETILAQTSRDDWELTFYITPQGQLSLRVNKDGVSRVISTGPGVVEVNNEVLLAASLYTEPDGNLGVLLFANGIVRGKGMIPDGRFISFSDGGTTVIGKNFSGIIDEFGVYYRRGQSVGVLANDLFLRAMESQFGEGLLFALSFEGNDLQSLDQGVRVSDGVYIRPGTLYLPPGEWLELPRITLELSKVEFHLGLLELLPEGFLVLDFLDEGNTVNTIHVQLDGLVQRRTIQNNEPVFIDLGQFPFPRGEDVMFTLERKSDQGENEGFYLVSHETDEPIFIGSYSENLGLSITLEQQKTADKDLGVTRVHMLQDNLELIDSFIQGFNPSNP